MYKHLTQNKKAVVFDLDGTVADTEPYWAIAFNTILQSIDEDVPLAKAYGLAGEPMYEKWARVKERKLIETPLTIKDLTDHTCAEFMRIISGAEITPREGFWSLLFELRKRDFKIGLATNTERKIAELEIRKLELENVFDFTVFGDDVKHKKPNPEIYIAVAKGLGVKPKEMLIFEDSVTGATAATKAGASLIVIWEGAPPKNSYPKQTLIFTSDFVGLAENLDLDMETAFNTFRDQVIKKPVTGQEEVLKSK